MKAEERKIRAQQDSNRIADLAQKHLHGSGRVRWFTGGGLASFRSEVETFLVDCYGANEMESAEA